MTATRPAAGETSEHFKSYIDLVPDGDIIRTLHDQGLATASFLREIPEDRGWHRYESDKWSLREVLGHLIDTERVMASRALCLARGGPMDLPGFDQDAWIANSEYDDRTIDDLTREFEAMRSSHVAMFGNTDGDGWTRAGTADGGPMTALAAAWIIAGHELHHVAVIQQRYL